MNRILFTDVHVLINHSFDIHTEEDKRFTISFCASKFVVKQNIFSLVRNEIIGHWHQIQDFNKIFAMATELVATLSLTPVTYIGRQN